MKILFIHPNFPGQFKHLAREFGRDKKNEVKFICRFPNRVTIDGVQKIVSKPITKNRNENGHRYLRGLNDFVYFAQAGWRACKELKDNGFVPDIIYAHAGWGDAMFVKDVYPDVPYIAYMEFFYRAFGVDIGFLPKRKVTEDDIARTRVRNANHLINLEACDWAVTPTEWQASVHPKDSLSRFSVIHEGIDTDYIKPLKERQNKLSLGGKQVPLSSEVITYITRYCEEYRGFEQAMEAIAILLKARPNATFIVVGKDGWGYGSSVSDVIGYKARALKNVGLEGASIHCFDELPYAEHIKLLQHSTVHIYLTVPFVLSWSALEAMSAGAAIVSSKTAPVEEVIQDGENGMLADFFNPSEIAQKVEFLLDNPKERAKIVAKARKTIEHKYSLKKIMPTYVKLIKEWSAKKFNTRTQQGLKPECLKIQ